MRILQWLALHTHVSSLPRDSSDLSAGIGKLCILGHLGLVFSWSCFVSCLLFLLLYVRLCDLCSGTCRKIRLIRGLSANSSKIAFEVPLVLAMSKAYMQLAGKIPGVNRDKIWPGMCGPLPKTLTLFMTNTFDFQYPL